jgi:uncharacterized tellurite resistance protein B-like protein
MFTSLSNFFQQHLSQDSELSSNNEHTLELCAAVLMLEIALADSSLDKDEYEVIEKTISYHFHLDKTETKELLELASKEVDLATSLHDFTRIVNDELSTGEKTTVIELLWRVAIADNVIDKYEEYFIRKISDLLYVSHSDYIKAKHRATA